MIEDVVVVVVANHHGQVKLCLFASDGVLALLAKRVSLITVEALEKSNVELTRLPNIETCGGLWRLSIQMHLSCCNPVHHDLSNIETRGD